MQINLKHYITQGYLISLLQPDPDPDLTLVDHHKCHLEESGAGADNMVPYSGFQENHTHN